MDQVTENDKELRLQAMEKRLDAMQAGIESEVQRLVDQRVGGFMLVWARMYGQQAELLKRAEVKEELQSIRLVPVGVGNGVPMDSDTCFLSLDNNGEPKLLKPVNGEMQQIALEQYRVVNFSEVLPHLNDTAILPVNLHNCNNSPEE